MSAVSDRITAEQLIANPDWKWGVELVEGQLVVMQAGGTPHSAASVAAAVTIGSWVRERGLGLCLTNEPGFILARDPDTVRAPDFAFIRANRVPDPPPDGYPELAPDFAIEVVGKDDKVQTVHDKARMWLREGVGELWVIDPRDRTATVHRPDEEPRTLAEDEEIAACGPLAGFSCRVSELIDF
jgi:Uma2 family endonuclease